LLFSNNSKQQCKNRDGRNNIFRWKTPYGSNTTECFSNKFFSLQPQLKIKLWLPISLEQHPSAVFTKRMPQNLGFISNRLNGCPNMQVSHNSPYHPIKKTIKYKSVESCTKENDPHYNDSTMIFLDWIITLGPILESTKLEPLSHL